MKIKFAGCMSVSLKNTFSNEDRKPHFPPNQVRLCYSSGIHGVPEMLMLPADCLAFIQTTHSRNSDHKYSLGHQCIKHL